MSNLVQIEKLLQQHRKIILDSKTMSPHSQYSLRLSPDSIHRRNKNLCNNSNGQTSLQQIEDTLQISCIIENKALIEQTNQLLSSNNQDNVKVQNISSLHNQQQDDSDSAIAHRSSFIQSGANDEAQNDLMLSGVDQIQKINNYQIDEKDIQNSSEKLTSQTNLQQHISKNSQYAQHSNEQNKDQENLQNQQQSSHNQISSKSFKINQNTVDKAQNYLFDSESIYVNILSQISDIQNRNSQKQSNNNQSSNKQSSQTTSSQDMNQNNVCYHVNISKEQLSKQINQSINQQIQDLTNQECDQSNSNDQLKLLIILLLLSQNNENSKNIFIKILFINKNYFLLNILLEAISDLSGLITQNENQIHEYFKNQPQSNKIESLFQYTFKIILAILCNHTKQSNQLFIQFIFDQVNEILKQRKLSQQQKKNILQILLQLSKSFTYLITLEKILDTAIFLLNKRFEKDNELVKYQILILIVQVIQVNQDKVTQIDCESLKNDIIFHMIKSMREFVYKDQQLLILFEKEHENCQIVLYLEEYIINYNDMEMYLYFKDFICLFPYIHKKIKSQLNIKPLV